jgi:hypothetical protein
MMNVISKLVANNVEGVSMFSMLTRTTFQWKETLRWDNQGYKY